MAAGTSDATTNIRPCRADEAASMLEIVNNAAKAYEGVIPEDCRHDPYMSPEQLASEIAAGVDFLGCEIGGSLAGVMGLQSVDDVDLVRHAYVLPRYQGHGVGGTLIRHIEARTTRQILIGTWAAAAWAISFYEGHGYQLVSESDKTMLLRKYWTVSQRQVDTSVVLAKPAYREQATDPVAGSPAAE